MSYRGEDLDLRTPQGWTASGRDPVGSEPNWWTRSTVYKGGRADPIWVDDNVLACCNHAFDLAIAHRASEVRLEHLINAMTLNDAVAPLLEARGIGVVQLRRESGAVLASDIPAGPANGKLNPKRSEALEEALRQAADRAYPRRVPVGIDDLLHVLLDMKREIPGLQLLRRHATTWRPRNGAEPRLEPLPHLSRPFASEPRYEEARPRYASPAAHEYFTQTPQPLPPPAPRPTRERDTGSVGGATIDGLQNSRLDALDRAVRDLGLDLADDRKTLQSIVTDLQRNVASQVDDTNRFRGGLSDRFAALEDAVQRTRSEPSQIPSALFDRLGALERTIDSRLSDMSRAAPVPSGLTDRLATLERMLDQRFSEMGRGWSAVGDRLQALEQTTLRPAETGMSPLMAARMDMIVERLHAIEQSAKRPTEVAFPPLMAARLDMIMERLHGLEQSAKRPTEVALPPLMAARLDAVVDRLHAFEQTSSRPSEVSLPPMLAAKLENVTGLERKLDTLERTFQLILDRLTGMERKMGTEAAKPVDLAPLHAKLGDMEHSLVSRVSHSVSQSVDLAPVTELLSGIESRVAGLERSIENRSSETGRTVSFIGERLRAFEEQLGGQKTQIGDRIGQIERSLSAYAEKTVEAGSMHDRDLSELHEALVKLNANQQTLAGSLEQWRLDSTGDLSVVNNHLKSLEEITLRRDTGVDALATQVSAIHSAVAKRAVHKHRFHNWLFGTDEWYSASYDTEHWRARQAVDILRGLEGRPQQVRPTPPAPPPQVVRR